MATKVYKSGYQVIVDEELKPYNKYTTAKYCSFGFDGEICWIKDIADTEEYIYNDSVYNMTYEDGSIIGDKAAVENYLLGFIGDGSSNVPEVYKLVMNNEVLHIDIPTEQFKLTNEGDEIELMFENNLANGRYVFGNNTGSRIQWGSGGTLALYNSAATGLGTLTNIPTGNELAKWTFKRTVGTVEFYINDVYFDSWTGVSGAIYMRYLNRYSSVEGNMVLHYFAKKEGSGEKQYYWCNDGTGSKISGTNGGIDADIGGYVDDSVWVEI